MAQYFNHKLKEVVVLLRKDLPLAAIIYVNIYSVKYSLFSNPRKYGEPNYNDPILQILLTNLPSMFITGWVFHSCTGFRDALVACCGFGGKYNYNNDVGCAETIEVNGSRIFVGSSTRPSVRVVWDGIHYTEAANKFIFSQISTGAFSDPPLPLNMACHKSWGLFSCLYMYATIYIGKLRALVAYIYLLVLYVKPLHYAS